MGNTTIKIEVNSCQECPYFETANEYSTDGFDRMIDWICTKQNRTIQGGVEWHEERKVKVPDWCPIKL